MKTSSQPTHEHVSSAPPSSRPVWAGAAPPTTATRQSRVTANPAIPSPQPPMYPWIGQRRREQPQLDARCGRGQRRDTGAGDGPRGDGARGGGGMTEPAAADDPEPSSALSRACATRGNGRARPLCSARAGRAAVTLDPRGAHSWQTVFYDGLPGQNRTYQGDVKYPSLMALEGDDNEVLGQTFAVVFQYRGPGATSDPPCQFNYVNVTVSLP
eukprot:gene57268-biopygen50453